MRILPDGRATLAGVDWRDLKAVLTAASLHNYAELKKPLDAPNREYCERRRRLLDRLDEAFQAGVAATHAPHVVTRRERWERAQEDQRFRRLFDEMPDPGASAAPRTEGER